METTSGTIVEPYCNLVGGGMGKLEITDKLIIWKSAKGKNALSLGLFAIFLKKDKVIPIDSVIHLEQFSTLGGGGLRVFTSNGKKYSFDFATKESRDCALNYLKDKNN